jgi:hypothetical protein
LCGHCCCRRPWGGCAALLQLHGQELVRLHAW